MSTNPQPSRNSRLSSATTTACSSNDDVEELSGGTTDLESLPTVDELRRALPASPEVARFVSNSRRDIARRILGRGGAIAIVGPCSIHDRRAAIEFAEELRNLQDELGDAVLLVMRAYFEKPRTTLGWKGFLYDPDLDGSDDLGRGLVEARRLLIELAELGVPTATEMLEPLAVSYFDDLLSYGAIGARTTQSQIHRQLASAAGFAVGLKNGTDGNLDGAIQSVVAASAPHRCMGLDARGRPAVIATSGNPAAHLILRGGRSGPNFDAPAVRRAADGLGRAGCQRAVIVDCNHDNSGKDHRRQLVVAREVTAQVARGTRGLVGMMLESHLVEGRQEVDVRPLRYGQSVTDPCSGFHDTAMVLRELASAVRRATSGGSMPRTSRSGTSGSSLSATLRSGVCGEMRRVEGEQHYGDTVGDTRRSWSRLSR